MNFTMAKFIINLINKPGGMKTLSTLAKSLNKKPGNLIKSAFKKTSGRKGKAVKTMTPRHKRMTRKDERVERFYDDMYQRDAARKYDLDMRQGGIEEPISVDELMRVLGG